jgi:ankyrin repeat protein
MEIVRVLLDAGFDMNFSNPPWETPLTEAIRYDRDDIARVLLEHSYDTLPQSDEEVEGPREDDTSIECPDASKALEYESCLG